MYTAIRAASLTIQRFLIDGFNSDPSTGATFGTSGPRVVTLTNPEEMQTANLQGVSLWLYQVLRDDQRLNAPPRRPTPREIQQTPLPLRLHYLVTPIVRVDQNDPELSSLEEQAILGKVLQLLHTHPRFAGVDLRGDLTGTDATLSARLEAMPIEDVARVWWALQRPYQLSVCYEVSLSYVAASVQPELSTPVERVEPEFAVIVGSEARV